MTASPEALSFDLKDYTFDLPDQQIAQSAVTPRHASRLLVVDRARQSWSDVHVSDLLTFLPAGAVLVVNDTQVVPARLRGRKASGGAVELLLERPFGGPSTVQVRGGGDGLRDQPALVKTSKPLQLGQVLQLEGLAGATATITALLGQGRVRVDLAGADSLGELLDACGHVPLPPYIRGGRDDPGIDRPRYQCVYARTPGAVAAPTAGLHFSDVLLAELEAAGVERLAVTLHVGPGTFLPVRTTDLREHRVEPERYEITEQVAARLTELRAQGRPIVAIGTTTTRVLEHLAQRAGDGPIPAGRGEADLTILPGHRFGLVRHLFSNFHLPESSLLVLVAAFAGRDTALAAYRHAVASGYRFYSYGDATLFL